MKRGILLLLAVWIVWLSAGCAVSETAPTIRPTETNIPTATEKGALQPVAPTLSTTSTTPVPTEAPATTSLTEIAMSTKTATVEPTVMVTTEQTLSQPIPNIPPPTGKILMLWDPSPPAYGGENITLELYQILPGANMGEWQIDVVLEDMILANDPATVAPDQTKLALSLLYDTDGNGKVEISGPYTHDISNLYVYDVNTESLTQLTDVEYNIFSASWLSDSKSLLYAQTKDVWLTHVENSNPEKFLTLPGKYINQVSLSPDNQLLVMLTHETPGGSIIAFHAQTNQTIPIQDDALSRDMKRPRWSPDGQWLAFGQFGSDYFRHLSLLQTDTLELTTSLIPYEDIVSTPAWSSDGRWLAFTKNRNTLSLWHNETLTVTDVLSATYISPPVWASDKSRVAVGLVQGEEGQVLTYDADTEALEEWGHVPNVQTIEVLGWSPDNKWLIFYLADELSSGLYLVHEDGDTYQVLDTTGGDVPVNLIWLP